VPAQGDRIRRTARDLRCIGRQRGRGAALRWLLDRLRYVVYRRADHLVIVKSLSDRTPAGALPAGDTQVVRAERRHLPSVAEFDRRHCNSLATRRHARLGEGLEAFLAFVGQELAGQIWLVAADSGRTHVDVVRLGLPLEDDDAYAFDMFVAAEHRGHGMASRFLAAVAEELAASGFRRVWGFVDSSNVPARWLYSTGGWRTVRRSRSWHLLGLLAVIDGRPYVTVAGSLRPLSRT
jgi:ribosomal protein S18 acetylase RimI-like enzyme